MLATVMLVACADPGTRREVTAERAEYVGCTSLRDCITREGADVRHDTIEDTLKRKTN